MLWNRMPTRCRLLYNKERKIAMVKSVLSAKHIYKSFGSNNVLEDISIEFYSGKVHALLGVNGAGKSTLVKILQGIYKYDAGSLAMEGQEVRFAGPFEAMDRGISMVFQELNLFGEMTVTENVMGNRMLKHRGLIDWKGCHHKVKELLDSLSVAIDPRVKVKTLSLAQQQLIEIAKCVYTNPKVLFLDEPSSSLSKAEETILYDLVRNLRQKGIAIVLITHKMEEVFQLCDTLSILRDGKCVAEGRVDDFKLEVITAHMLGKAVEIFKRTKITNGDPEQILFEVQNLNYKNKLHDVSLQLSRGEILAVSGLVGSGKSDLARTIFGVNRGFTGDILLEGERLRIASPYEASAKGIGYVPISRKDEGILGNLTAQKNITISMLDKVGFLINRKKEHDITLHMMEDFNVQPKNTEQNITSFSGGNQQKIVLSRWIAANKKLVLLDEPTRGVDVGAKQEIYDNLKRLAAQGVGIIIFSSETDELLSSSDRILIMREGRIVKELITARTSSEEILHYSIAAAD